MPCRARRGAFWAAPPAAMTATAVRHIIAGVIRRTRACILPTLTRRDSIFKTPNLFMQKARAIAIAGAFAGGLLFAYTLHAAGLTIVLRQIRQIGAGFGVVLLLSGIRMAVRSQAWALCVERRERFTFRDALTAFVIGDAIGNLTPLGPVASEGTKAILSRQNLPALDAVSSVGLEN